ncbi:macrocin O-methyltransferase [Hyphococcus flavus]|uniref:Macrocin O-methyltransferase n=1 Tax=Hyphococcus flavus TaxID=1866326 RepID=A0AAF0CI40_9PROT|nr:TylF/MycF/NovP-related O-methyltransferase [Hyphococcus flavus]WDI32487.1 macrocin O-methyltransferase [Hyphococcus flavus]
MADKKDSSSGGVFYGNLEKNRNTESQLGWYQQMADFANENDWRPRDQAANFPVFATRQEITRFIEAYEFYNLIRTTPGCIIECGVASGFFLMAMAHFCAIFEGYHYTRRIIGFDTFEGFTEPSPEDLSSGAAHLKKGGLKFETHDLLQRAIELYDGNRPIGHIPKVELVKGDMSKTLPEFIESNPSLIVGMLHLDVDLFEPTKNTINLLMERIPKGGVIIFDEPNHKDYPGETIAMMQTVGIPNLRLERLPISTMAAYARVE